MRKWIISFLVIYLLTSCGNNNLSTNAVASTNGECPSTHPIKGNRNIEGEWIYHLPGGQYYKRTNAEECFEFPVDAQNAGYRASKR